MFRHLKVGDIATRLFFGRKQRFKVTHVDDKLITIGLGWTFDRDTGLEVDEDIPSMSQCSWLVP